MGHYKYTMHNAITITKESPVQNSTLHTGNLALVLKKNHLIDSTTTKN